MTLDQFIPFFPALLVVALLFGSAWWAERRAKRGNR
jgi:hypothetical protein